MQFCVLVFIMKKFSMTPVRAVSLTFLAVIFTGALLLTLPIAARNGQSTNFIDALFTASSATCVTGLTVVDTYTHWTLFGQIVILCLIQIGGLGFMTIFTMISLALKRNIMIRERKILMQSTGAEHMGGIIRLIKRILRGTIFFELLGTLLLAIRFCGDFGFVKGLYMSLFHAVSAFCNAGFDILGVLWPGASLIPYRSDWLVMCTIMGLITIGGLGFLVWSDIVKFRFNFKKFGLHSKIVIATSVLLVVVSTLLFLLLENAHTLKGMSAGDKLLNAMFMAVTPRTAGFYAVDYGQMSESGSLLTMLLMFIGGSSGSTAGGIKTTTFAVLLLAMYTMIRNRDSVCCFKRKIHSGAVALATSVAFIYLAVNVVSAGILCAIQDFSIREALFEVISATGTVGLTCGITPDLHPFSKCLVSFLMYGGRVGLLSLAIGLGEQKRTLTSARPVESVMIG